MNDSTMQTFEEASTGVSKFAAFSLSRPITISMVFVSMLTIGLISSRLLPLESMPEIKLPFFYVFVPYQAGTPEEVERTITRPLEEALATIGDIEDMNSNSTTNGGGVGLMFAAGVDVDEKAMLIKEQVDLLRPSLPNDVRHIEINKAEAGEETFMKIRITGKRNLEGAYDLLNQYLVKPVQRVPGVAKVELQGIEPLEISIKLDNERMKRYNIGFTELQKKIGDVNFNVGSGNFSTENQVIRITPKSKAMRLTDYQNLLLNEHNVRLKDVADVEILNGERNYARHLDRKYSVGLEIYKESTANLVQVADDVVKTIRSLDDTPQMAGIQLVFLENQAEGVKNSLTDVVMAGITGSLLSLLVLFVFLRNWAMTLIISLSIPVSIIITLGVMYFAGITLNNLSLMGLMLAIGMLVDNSVVITESIFTQKQKNPGQPRRSIIEGVKQVMTPVIAGTLTTICVFLPLIVGKENLLAVFMIHVAVAIIAALVISLMLSVTVVPMAIYQFAAGISKQIEGKKQRSSISAFWNRLSDSKKWLVMLMVLIFAVLLADQFGVPEASIKILLYVSLFFIFALFFTDHYAKVLKFTLSHRWFTVAMIILLVVTGVVAKQLMVEDDGTGQSVKRSFWMPFHINGAYSLERLKQDVDTVENYLYANKDKFDIDSVYTYYQENEWAGSMITLIPAEFATKPVSQIKKEIIEGMPKIATGAPAFRWRSSSGEEGIKVYLQGDSSQHIRDHYLDDVIFALKQVEKITNVQVEQKNNRQELQVEVDRVRALNLGLSPIEVAQSVNIAMRGMNLKEFVTPNGEVPVKMRFYKKGEFEIDQLKDLPIKNNEGVSVPLENVAHITQSSTPQRLQRKGRESTIEIDIDVEDEANVKEVKEAISKVLNVFPFASGYHWSFDGGGRGFNVKLDDLARNLFIAIALIFIIMAAMFESLLFPICVITSIFFSYVGTWVMFAFTGTTFNVMAGIGMLILIGVIVNNGIVLIDHINQLRAKGMNRFEAIIQGGQDRLRPILMTVSTTVVGLIPLSVSSSGLADEGGASYFPMARAIIGGLTFSTVVSLVILPSLYCWLDDLRLWTGARWRLERKQQRKRVRFEVVSND